MTINHFSDEVPAVLCQPGVSADEFREQARTLLLEDPFRIFDLVPLYARYHPRQQTAGEERISRLLYALRQAISGARDSAEQRYIIETHLAPRLKISTS